jgi:hypothetical protein
VGVTKIGPLKAWRVDYNGESPSLLLNTGDAEYLCCQPAAVFKKLFIHLKEQAEIAYEVGPSKRTRLGRVSDPCGCTHVCIPASIARQGGTRGRQTAKKIGGKNREGGMK